MVGILWVLDYLKPLNLFYRMASVKQIKIVVVAEDKATAPIERATTATRNLGKETKKVTKESKKDWGGLADLFGGVLPRNLQSLQRGFKGTQRQVGRLSKSFKLLKTAWASIGIGVIILAVEELVSNWDDWSEMLGFTNKELIENEKAQKRVTEQQTASKAELQRYQKTVEDTTASELDREAALKKLAKALPQLEGLELGSLEANEKIAQAMADQLAIIKLKDDEARNQKKTEEAITAEQEQQVRLTAEQSTNVSLTADIETKLALRREYLAENRAVKEAEWAAESAAASQSQRDTDSEINIIEQRITDQIEEQNKLRGDANEAEKELEKTAREAEAAKKKAIQDAAADLKWLENQRIQLANETELQLIADEETRDLRSLEIQNASDKAELELRKGTIADKLALEDKYILDKEAIETDYEGRRKEKQADEDAQDIADAAMVTQALATEEENEIIRVREQYARLKELADENSLEYKQLAEQEGAEVTAIEEKFLHKQTQAQLKANALKLQGQMKMAGAVRGILGSMGDMAEEGSERQRNFAIVDVLLSQAIAIGNAIAGATAAAAASTVAAPVVTPILIAQMVGQVMVAFAGIKGIMDKAGASMPSGGGGGGGGGGGSSASAAQVPLPARLDSPDNMQAYVVQSQLQGQLSAQVRLEGQIVL
tara:strand:+ start:21431 stop:23413 length:1983 start_codon:yes stop_codon:yes gene_type:complete